MSKLLLALALCTTVAATAAPAFAQTRSVDPDEIQIRVNFSDLNLASASGAAVLDHRISRAVEQICGRSDLHDLANVSAIKACRTAVLGRVAAPRAAAIAAAQTAKPTELAVLAPN